jgi:Fic family protein
MSGIPRTSDQLGPEAQKLLDYLCDHPNEKYTVAQLLDVAGCSEDEAKVHLEALAYQGEIEKERPEGGETVYCRPRRT